METPRIRYARASDGVSIAYAVVGEGFPFVTVPGWVSHLEESQGLALDGYRNVLYDKRGTGLPDRGLADYSLDARVKDLEAVVDAVGLDRFILRGFSEGGPIAIQYAATHPERVAALILGGTWSHGGTIPSDVHAAVLSLVKAEWGLASFTLSAMFAPGATQEEAEAIARRHRHGATPEDAARIWAELPDIDVTRYLDSVHCPVLVQHIVGDRVVPFEKGRRLAASIPNAKFVPIEGIRHTVGPVEFQQMVDTTHAFLDEVLPQESRRHADAEAERSASRGSFRTILFTDVVASTPLLTQLRDARMREVMRDHDAVMEAAVTGHGGRVVKTIGDAFMAEFAVPSAAVEAAIEAQRQIRDKFAASDVPVRIRIGINAGEPIEENGDLHGASVVIAKRLESAADVNGILVSDVVKQMVTGKDFEFEDRGLVELKGFEEPVRAWAVRW